MGIVFPPRLRVGFSKKISRIRAIRPLVVAGGVNDRVTEPVEPAEASPIQLVGAGTPENVAHVHDPAQVVRIHFVKNERILEIFQA